MSFLIAKIVKTALAPANLFSLLLLLAGFACVSHNERWQRAGRRLCFLLAITLFLVGVLPVGHWSLNPLENRFPPERPERVDGIILLAGDETPFLTENRKQASARESARRYITFAGLSREYPRAKLAFLGGNPDILSKDTMTNADVARALLKAVGVPTEKVVIEDKSRNTYENAIMGSAAVKPGKDDNWLLVTSASHMPRALLTFRKAGWNVYPAPTNYYTAQSFPFRLGFNVFRQLRDLNTAVYEHVGLIVYWILGRIDYPWGQ